MAKKLLPLKPTLEALDRRDKTYYDRLSDEDKKAFAPYLLLRYASTVEADDFYTEHYIEKTNELVNVNYMALSKHPKLMWMLFSMIGAYKVQRHTWLPPRNKQKKSKYIAALEHYYPSAKLSDLELLEQVLSTEELDKILEDYAGQNQK